MKLRNIISSFILTASMSLGTAQAGNMTIDELFDYLQAGDENSIQSVETVEFSRMEFRDTDSASEHIYKQSISDVFNTINSD